MLIIWIHITFAPTAIPFLDASSTFTPTFRDSSIYPVLVLKMGWTDERDFVLKFDNLLECIYHHLRDYPRDGRVVIGGAGLAATIAVAVTLSLKNDSGRLIQAISFCCIYDLLAYNEFAWLDGSYPNLCATHSITELGAGPQFLSALLRTRKVSNVEVHLCHGTWDLLSSWRHSHRLRQLLEKFSVSTFLTICYNVGHSPTLLLKQIESLITAGCTHCFEQAYSSICRGEFYLTTTEAREGFSFVANADRSGCEWISFGLTGLSKGSTENRVIYMFIPQELPINSALAYARSHRQAVSAVVAVSSIIIFLRPPSQAEQLHKLILEIEYACGITTSSRRRYAELALLEPETYDHLLQANFFAGVSIRLSHYGMNNFNFTFVGGSESLGYSRVFIPHDTDKLESNALSRRGVRFVHSLTEETSDILTAIIQLSFAAWWNLN